MGTRSGWVRIGRIAATFPSKRPLEVIVTNIHGTLPCTANGSQYMDVMTDRYSELMRALPTGKTSSAYAANVFFESWTVTYGIPAYVLLGNEAQFPSRSFATLCTMLGVRHLTTTAFHPQSSEQVETVQKYDSHSTATLCCREPGEPRQVLETLDICE